MSGPSPDVDREARAEAGPFTSTLSVAEFSFATHAQLEPVTAVHGCQVRWISQPLPVPDLPRRLSKGPAAKVTPVDKLDTEIAHVRRDVLGQLAREAAEVGADGVIGIRQLAGVIDWKGTAGALGRRARSPGRGSPPHLVRPLEYQLIGTAVRDPADRSSPPRLSTLSAPDMWKLRRMGWRAVGIAAACSYQFCLGSGLWAGSVAREVDPATEAWATARLLAFDRMRDEAGALGADGVVGVDMQVEHRHFDWEKGGWHLAGLLVGVNLIGTAISHAAVPDEGLGRVDTIISLR
jgi:uncharacterized protein YbjQ (UPF0145 family)